MFYQGTMEEGRRIECRGWRRAGISIDSRLGDGQR